MSSAPKLIILIIFICVIGSDLKAQMDSIASSPEPHVPTVNQSWSLPKALQQISGIAYINETHYACVQEEMGNIFVVNAADCSISATIKFGPPGDYQGIAVVNDDAYIACADGRILEISNFLGEKPTVKEFGTHLTVRQNAEGICYDRKNKRLLVAIKGQEEGSPLYKGIYEFDLVAKKMPVKPLLKIDLLDSIFREFPGKKPQTLIQPSEIAIDPKTGELYLTDGVRSSLMIMDSTGRIKALYALKKSEFSKPEGMMFTPSGELYIANQGSRQILAKLLLARIE